MTVMGYPTTEQVEQAGKEQIARWYRFLPAGENDEQVAVLNRLCVRFKELGGFDSPLSKKVGWGAGVHHRREIVG